MRSGCLAQFRVQKGHPERLAFLLPERHFEVASALPVVNPRFEKPLICFLERLEQA